MNIRSCFRIPALTWGLALMALSPVSAKDLALIASGGPSASPNGPRTDLTQELVQRYRDAGYRVIDGRRADRKRLIKLIQDFEDDAGDADRLVIHLTGPLAEAAGLTFFLPRDASPRDATEVLAQGVPMALFLNLAAKRPGRNLVALGISNERNLPNLGLDIPRGVLVLRGLPRPVGNVVMNQMLDGVPMDRVDTRSASVVFDGRDPGGFRLARPDNPNAGLSPLEREQALKLTRDERRQIQRDLTVLGFNTGGVDGVLGNRTRRALLAWQGLNGLPETGFLSRRQWVALTEAAAARRVELKTAETELDAEKRAWDEARKEDTIKAYRRFVERYPNGRFEQRALDRMAELQKAAEVARRIADYRAREKDLGLTVASVAVVEKRLAALGYETGPQDGRLDRTTRRSIAAFQSSRGLQPTGYINSPTLQRLIIAGGGN